MEIQKRLDSHPASKKMGIFRRPRTASLKDTPKKLTKEKERVAPSPPEDRIPKKGKGIPVPSAQDPKGKKKMPKRSPTAWWGVTVRVLAKDGETYAEILKAIKAKVNPQNVGAEVLPIRRTRREEILLVLKKEADVSEFEKELDQAIGYKAEVKSLVSGTSAGCTSASAVCRLWWSVQTRRTFGAFSGSVD